ncbi:MAG: hypothetical protein QOE45_3317 [Frankiaceae bacterium]|jgi:hypothetical protein|nr:hypothetical protein [Frankiaceae bacterium]
MSVRRVLSVLSLTFALVAVAALPASAAPDQATCQTLTSGASALRVCVDVTGTSRGVYVEGAGLSVPANLVQYGSELWQCNISSCVAIATNYQTYSVTGTPTATLVTSTYPVQFGHTYYACAEVSVNGNYYGWRCSGTRAN